MPDLEIVRLGHPALRSQSRRVGKKELASPAFQLFLDQLAHLCDANDGVGIAAPQVGVNTRVIVVHVDPKNPRYEGKAPFPLTIVVNPKITARSEIVQDDWEGDLSCNLRALVPRATTCVVSGLNRQGEPVHYDVQNSFHARVFQHEIDHLDGIFLLDHVTRYETICELAEWEKYWKGRSV